jgi:DMSO/TMAO reductase YedYZ heme-binding membrane subunit
MKTALEKMRRNWKDNAERFRNEHPFRLVITISLIAMTLAVILPNLSIVQRIGFVVWGSLGLIVRVWHNLTYHHYIFYESEGQDEKLSE